MIRTALATALLATATAGTMLASTADAATPGVTLNTHRVVTHSTLPSCTEEDASAGPIPCSWNFVGRKDGNGVGLAYFVTGTHSRPHFHYVWASTPHRKGYRWVDAGWARAMRSDKTLAPRRWKACIIRVADTTVIRCADGSRFTS